MGQPGRLSGSSCIETYDNDGISILVLAHADGNDSWVLHESALVLSLYLLDRSRNIRSPSAGEDAGAA
jgi:hypothetical protein